MDAKRLRRAISELIENSMNYMELGQLSVCTSVVDRGTHAATRRSSSKRFVQIEIEDTGPGVNDDQKAVIFQPFFSNRVKGMGLGLSIVKGIVDAHGGEVFEAGEEGKGAKFVILLPVANRP
jgi:signal transduction histidine kinase